MKHTTLYMKVGRAAPKPVCTLEGSGSDKTSQLDHHKQIHLAEAIAGGNDPARISFETETVDVDDLIAETEARQSAARAVRKARNK